MEEKITRTPDKDGDYTVCGTIDKAIPYAINYKIQGGMAFYQVNYYGADVQGEHQNILYAYTAKGPKDAEVIIPHDVNELMTNLLAGLDSDAVVNAEEQTDALKAYMKKNHGHDIMPFQEKLSEEKGCEASALTYTRIKDHATGAQEKLYGIDTTRNQSADAKPAAIADDKAEKNLYYYVVLPNFSVIFNAGVAVATVEKASLRIHPWTMALWFSTRSS